MTCAYSFRCDAPGCGATGTGVRGQYVYPDPPAGWMWGFGFQLEGPHACSPEHWLQVQDEHRARTGKVFITESHERREQDGVQAQVRTSVAGRPPATRVEPGTCDRCGKPLPPYSGKGRHRKRHAPPCPVDVPQEATP